MGLFQCKIFSKELYRSVNVNVVIPLPDSNNDFFGADIHYPQPGEKYPVLYLLHGFSADESDWQRFSRVESYAQERNIAIVMPDGYNSFYENSPFGAAYSKYIAEELVYKNNELFYPEQIIKDFTPEVKNYPTDIPYGNMTNNTPEEKERLLAKWTFS